MTMTKSLPNLAPIVGTKTYAIGYDFHTGEVWTKRTAKGRQTPYTAKFDVKSDGSIKLNSIDYHLLEYIAVEEQLKRQLSLDPSAFALRALIEEAEAAADAVGNDEQAPPCHKASLEDIARYADCGCFEIAQNEKGDA